MSWRCDLTGKEPLVGHKVSHSNIKTKRRFLPNLLNVTLISDALGRSVKMRVSANAFKTVDHRGGLDAFLAKAKDSELSPLDLPHRGVIPDMLGDISPLLGERAFLVAQEVVDEVQVSEEFARLCVRIVRETRSTEGIELGASPRAARHLMTGAKARAAAQGRKSVEAEDVTWLAPYVLSHRVSAADTTPREIVELAVQKAVGR